MLKSVTPSQSLGAVGAADDLDQIGKDQNAEASRDYTSRIDDLIKRIQAAQSEQHSTKEGDVTEHAILEALESSIREANLTKFETFLGENWSPERLRVMILDRVGNDIGSLFDGTNRGEVTMNDLDLMIKKAANQVYTRLFETSELLAANRSSTLFVERLYQTHGDLVNGEVRESAEQLLANAASSGAASLEPSLRRDPNAYALRYRAQRIIYDCLSDNVEAISSSESGMATPAEISKAVLDVTRTECAKWVSGQLVGGDGKVKSQEPMPLRVIWTAEGPRMTRRCTAAPRTSCKARRGSHSRMAPGMSCAAGAVSGGGRQNFESVRSLRKWSEPPSCPEARSGAARCCRAVYPGVPRRAAMLRQATDCVSRRAGWEGPSDQR